MVSQKVVIKNPTGLHLRPAGILCKEAMQFQVIDHLSNFVKILQMPRAYSVYWVLA